MIAATTASQRPPAAKLLFINASGALTHARRSALVSFLHRGDVVVANDAATLPASLHGVHLPSGAAVEVRLAGRRSLVPGDVASATAILFGAGDFHTPTEHRPPPPAALPGDTLQLGPLTATVSEILGHPRCVTIEFSGTADEIWAGIARHGRPIQYAHLADPLALWDVWTSIAGPPAAFEPPSAGFVIDWRTLAALRSRSIEFVTLTHAAGISSTGDAALDARLPFDEPYHIPMRTASRINHARRHGRRIVAIGTTVVRALEHATTPAGDVQAGYGVATQRISAETPLHVVDAIVSGVHEPATSHYQLLSAFTDAATLRRADNALEASGYRTHEFGDSVLIERKVSIPKTCAGFRPDRSFSPVPA